MEIEYFGLNTLKISYKKITFVIDDVVRDGSKKTITKPEAVSLQTDAGIAVQDGSKLLINTPGEFEIGDVSINAVAVRGHRDEEDQKTATIYRLHHLNFNVVIVGHAHPDITDEQVEQIGDSDLVIIPVGGHGFTLDPAGALKVIKKLSPNFVLPTYYQVSGITADMPQITKEDALVQLGLPAVEPVDALKLKDILALPVEQVQVITVNPKSI